MLEVDVATSEAINNTTWVIKNSGTCPFSAGDDDGINKVALYQYNSSSDELLVGVGTCSYRVKYNKKRGALSAKTP